jgi:hypothetical protein
MEQLEEARELRVRLARRSGTADVAVALRLRGLSLTGPWPGRTHVIVRGQRIEPDPRPGFLVVDGRHSYSSDWL